MQQSTVEFWKGDFGNGYIGRNRSSDLRAAYQVMWAKILTRTSGIKSVLEVGANIGVNIEAIRNVLPSASYDAIEPNETAAAHLEAMHVRTHRMTAEEMWRFDTRFDLVFTRGVLIHVDPAHLDRVYQNLHQHAGKYIVVAEYFNPRREMIPYRGELDKLWKADFAGDMLDAFEDLHLVDYGFVWNRDPIAPQDNVTWFLLEKRA